MKPELLAFIGVVFIIAAVAAIALIMLFSPAKPAACLADAKLCPDGSTVGRAGPDCEFSPCPVAADKKACTSDGDCEIKYNIGYNGRCSADCFNRDSTADPGCKLLWEAMAGSCDCARGQCTLQQPAGCQEDAKVCPDGSTVARVPPSCEFAPCPKPPAPPVNATLPANATPPAADPCDRWISSEKKAECYSLRAQNEGNMSLCDLISVQNLKEACYDSYARMNKDPSACMYAGEDREEACFKSANGWVDDYNYCLNIPENDMSLENARDECLLKAGIRGKDIAACGHVIGPHDQKECYRQVSAAVNTVEACLAMAAAHLWSPSTMDVANDVTLCFRNVNKVMKDTGICSSLDSYDALFCVYYCILDNRLGESRCTGLDLDEEYACRAVATMDETLCDQIGDGNKRGWCEGRWVEGDFCFDSDGDVATMNFEGDPVSELNYYEAGHVLDDSEFLEDKCLTADVLVERFCTRVTNEDYGFSLGYYGSTHQFKCPRGCSSGQCI